MQIMKIFLLLLLAGLLTFSPKAAAQTDVYPLDSTSGYIVPRIFLFGPLNQYESTNIPQWCRFGFVFDRQAAGTKVYGVSCSLVMSTITEEVWAYLYVQRDTDWFICVDSARIDNVTPVNTLKVPYYPNLHVDMSTTSEEFSAMVDTTTNVQYVSAPLYDVIFPRGYCFDTCGIAVALGPRMICQRDHTIIQDIGRVRFAWSVESEKSTTFSMFHETDTFNTNRGYNYHAYVFPVVSRDLWLERMTSHCEGVTGLTSEDVDGRTARLHWSGAGGHATYEVAVGPADSAAESYTVYGVADTEFLYRNMDFGVQYAFRVRGLCQYEDTIETWSPWSGTVQFERPGCYLTLVTRDSLMGYAYGSGYYEPQTDVTIEAFANEGYAFIGWNDSIQDNPRTLTITHDTTFTALFAFDSSLLQGIGEVGTLDFTVAPNPTTGRLMITVPLAGAASAWYAGAPSATVMAGGETTTGSLPHQARQPKHIHVYQVSLLDMSGRALLSTQADGPVVEMDISLLPAGQYLLVVRHLVGASASLRMEKPNQWGIRAIIKK